MLRVAAELLVSPLSAECHGDVSGGELGQCSEPQHRQVRHRLVHEPDEVLEVERQLVERQLELVVVGAECSGHLPCAVELFSWASLKPTENVFTGSLMWRGHERNDHARVEPAAEHRAERNVAHQTDANRLVEKPEELLHDLDGRPARASPTATGSGYDPVPLDADGPVLDDEPLAGEQLRYTAR